MPDTLYIHDLHARRVIFSNHHLGQQLGYNQEELARMGGNFWETLLHPDDQEYYWRIRNLQHVVGDGLLLDSQLRWRHRDAAGTGSTSASGPSAATAAVAWRA